MDFSIIKKGVSVFFTKTVKEFFKNTFEINYSKKSKITGSVLCILSLILVVLSVNTYSSLKYSVRWILLAVDLALPFLIALAVIYTVKMNIRQKVYSRRLFATDLILILQEL